MFWPLMEPYSYDYVEVSHIIFGSVMLPMVGGKMIFISYAFEEWI